VFPALDRAGAVRYLQARSLKPGNGPKYLNPAADLAANPRLAWTVTARPAPPPMLVICEGIPDSLIAAQAGYRTVAVLGAHAPDSIVAAELGRQAHRDRSHLVAIIDNDDAGHAWGHRLQRLLREQRTALTVITPPTPGADLNDWACHDPNWTATIAASTPTPWISLAGQRRAVARARGIDLV
jgi:DNA primase